MTKKRVCLMVLLFMAAAALCLGGFYFFRSSHDRGTPAHGVLVFQEIRG